MSTQNKTLRFVYHILIQLGFDPKKGIRSFRGMPPFLRDLRQYKRLANGTPGALPVGSLYPIMHERYAVNGYLDWHYFYMDLWAARRIYSRRPAKHVDIGSSVPGFVSHLLTFMPVELVDVRPTDALIDGLSTVITDATHLAAYEDNSVDSISSLHAGEHFGLGRYGDPINPMGHVQFMRALTRVVKPGGRIYYAVPCGRERLMFNAQRIISPHTITNTIGLPLVSFSCVTDDNKFHEDCAVSRVENEAFGCGMFEFTK